MSSQKEEKRRVFISLTFQEENYYTKIFDLLDYEKEGKISSSLTAHFMRDSLLNDNILKEIFLLTSHKNIYFIEKEEFFIILRLIALAQNKIPFTENSLEKNNPIPPLPIFYLMQKDNLLNKKNLFEITQNIEKVYMKLFNEKKDTRKDYISKLRTILIWNEKNPKDIDVNEKIMESLEPLKQKDFLNYKEFVVGCYLLHLSRIIKMPIKLPKILLIYLGRISDNILNNTNINLQTTKNKIVSNANEANIHNNKKTQMKMVENPPLYGSINIGNKNYFNKNELMLNNEQNVKINKSLAIPKYNMQKTIENINIENKANNNIKEIQIERIENKDINDNEMPIQYIIKENNDSNLCNQNINPNLNSNNNNNECLPNPEIEIEKALDFLKETNINQSQYHSMSNRNAQSAYINDINSNIKEQNLNNYNNFNNQINSNNNFIPVVIPNKINMNQNVNYEFNN